jgi:hypothetical protein
MRPKKHRSNHRVTILLVGAEVEDEVVLEAVKEVSYPRHPSHFHKGCTES